MRYRISLFMVSVAFLASSCKKEGIITSTVDKEGIQLVVLGNLQDGGSPHIGCQKTCCIDLYSNPDPTRMVVSLGIIDHSHNATYLFEATPDISRQVEYLRKHQSTSFSLEGIFLTHAHIGHYSGLMYLGKEAWSTSEIPVYTMPRMKKFLAESGPWSQLVTDKNILLKSLIQDSSIMLSENLNVFPFLVPHRDEFSETVGYRIMGNSKTALFIPDIDKWEKWDKHIEEEIADVDYAFIDATFYDAAEVNHRDVREIPHPFVEESMNRFASFPESLKAKIYFIHFNHTNPLIDEGSKESIFVNEAGYNIARFGDVFNL